MAWEKCVIYMAVVLNLLTPTLSLRSTIYELDNASRSNDVEVAKLDWSKCAIRYADFSTSAVRFTTGVPQQCESLNLEWTINPIYEPGFLYARKRRSSEDFRANGGICIGKGDSYKTTLPVLLEPGVSIIFELIPHVDDALTFNILRTSDDQVMHFVCREQLDTLVIKSKVDGDYEKSNSLEGCPFVNNVTQTLVFEIQTDMGIKISLDGRVLTTYDSALDPRVARSLNFYESGPEDFITLNRIEFIKM